MKESLFQTENWSVLLARWNDATAALTCLLGKVGPGDPISFCNPQSYDHDLDDIDYRGFGLFRISHHLVGSFEEGFVLNFFQYLMHWLSEYSPDHLIVI